MSEQLTQPKTDGHLTPTIIATVIYVLIILPDLAFAMISPMLFDSPGSEKNEVLYVVVWCVLGYTPVTLITIVLMWILYAKKKKKFSYVVMTFPLILILIGFVALLNIN